MKAFFLILFGQFVSLMGSGMTGFALGVWIFQSTGSVTRFALIAFCASLPGILISPIAGALIDRYDRRWIMVLSDAGAGVCTLAIGLMLWTGHLEIWHIYIIVAISSAFVAFQWPAHSAAITLLVPKQQLGRASGMVQSAQAAAQIIAPVMAGLLIGIVRVEGIVLIDFATFLFAVLTLLIVRIPAPPKSQTEETAKSSLWQEALYGWRYIKARPGLMQLLRFFAVTNFLMSMAVVLISPLVLSFTTAAVLGVVLTVAACGMLAGSVLLSIWGGPKRRLLSILGCSVLQAIFMIVGGLRPSAVLVAIAAFGFLFANALVTGSSQIIWQTKVASDVQGRVFAVRRMIAWSSIPLAYLVAGPLADKVVRPLMDTNGLLAGSVGRVIGAGPGRGIALLLIILGFITLLITLASYFKPRLRMLEDELPDALPKEAALPVQAEIATPAGS
jgi:MFS transporter, DHA3 family, macrolide efflux protein